MSDMREILFRGKRTDNGEWVKGMLNVLTKKTAQIGGYTDYGTHVCIGNSYAVDPATVGQYTGLRDKNARRIFDGDIVELDGFLYVVKWIECGWFIEKIKSNAFRLLFTASFAKDSEAVGNIHDNPELLEAQHGG